MLNKPNHTVTTRFAITPDIRQQLREIASQLHPLPVHIPKWKLVDGSVLLSKGLLKIKKEGEESVILAGKNYRVPNGHILKNMNHLQNLISTYRKGGILAIHSYLVQLVEHEAKARVNFPDLFEENGKGKYKGV